MASLYSASIPPLIRGLQNLNAILTKASAYATSQNFSPDVFLTSRIHATMQPLPYQIQWASTIIISLLLTHTAPHRTLPNIPPNTTFSSLISNLPTLTTFASLQSQLQTTITFLQSLSESDFPSPSAADEPFTSTAGPYGEWVWNNEMEFLQFNIMSNFWFHVTTAYNILRMEGVPVGKMDFLNGAGEAVLREKREG